MGAAVSTERIQPVAMTAGMEGGGTMAVKLHAVPKAARKPRRARTTNPALLSADQAAHLLGVGVQTVRGWIADGRLYSTVVGVSGRVRRVPAGEVERVRQHGIGPYPHDRNGAEGHDLPDSL